MDNKLGKYLPERGTFIEVGAGDGYRASNTYYLERIRRWKGVLVEPIPNLYRKCAARRPNSTVFNCALVSDTYGGKTVTMRRGDLMSTVKGALGEQEPEHLERAAGCHGTDGREIAVPARTLTSVLCEAGVSHVDFFSLDVEGYESKVLEGLDLARFRPTYLLIECLDDNKRRDVEVIVGNLYTFVEQLSRRDFLYKSL